MKRQKGVHCGSWGVCRHIIYEMITVSDVAIVRQYRFVFFFTLLRPVTRVPLSKALLCGRATSAMHAADFPRSNSIQVLSCRCPRWKTIEKYQSFVLFTCYSFTKEHYSAEFLFSLLVARMFAECRCSCCIGAPFP